MITVGFLIHTSLGKVEYHWLENEALSIITISSILFSASCFASPLQRGSMGEWSACRTHNPAVPGLSPALATSWICSQLSRVENLGHTCK